MSGCIQLSPTIQTTKSYEGHFYNKEDAKAAIESIRVLNNDESIWILSNSTLKRVLKNNK